MGNNPILFLDPDGKKIFLASNLTQTQRMEILGSLQKLTNDKLVFKTLKDGSIQVKVANISADGNKPNGTNLVRSLNSHEKSVTIGSSGFDSWCGSKNSPSTEEEKKNMSNGVGEDAVVKLGIERNFYVEGENGTIIEKGSKSIILGHELIHAIKQMDGKKYT